MGKRQSCGDPRRCVRVILRSLVQQDFPITVVDQGQKLDHVPIFEALKFEVHGPRSWLHCFVHAWFDFYNSWNTTEQLE